VSHTVPHLSYAVLFRQPAVARTFLPALVGRLAYGVLPLSLLLTVQHATGSFASAASAMALDGLASLSMPVKARAIDRYGQRLVLPLVTAAIVVVLVSAATMARAGTTSPLPWLAVGLGVGLASPPLGPSMRAQWRALVPEHAIATAYAVDAACEETLYLIGPMLAAGMVAVAPAYAGLVVCAALVAVGAAGLACSPVATRTARLERRRIGRGPLRHLPYLGLLVVMAAVGGVTATIYTTTAARALAVGHPAYAGLADACVAAGSVVGGLAWGRLRPSWPWSRSLARLLAFLGAGLAVASAWGPFWMFVPLLAVVGLAISPMYVVAYQASDRLVGPTEVTEASTWVNTVTNLGIALGGAVAGLLVGHAGARAPGWLGAVIALGVAAVLRSAGGASAEASSPGSR
jgi:hypothetical protein